MEGAVSEEEKPELFYNGKDTVMVVDVQNFEGHDGSMVNGVFRTVGGSETAVVAKGDKFNFHIYHNHTWLYRKKGHHS